MMASGIAAAGLRGVLEMVVEMSVFVDGAWDRGGGQRAAFVRRGVHRVADPQLFERQGTAFWRAPVPLAVARGSAAVGRQL